MKVYRESINPPELDYTYDDLHDGIFIYRLKVSGGKVLMYRGTHTGARLSDTPTPDHMHTWDLLHSTERDIWNLGFWRKEARQLHRFTRRLRELAS